MESKDYYKPLIQDYLKYVKVLCLDDIIEALSKKP